jgi:CO/xanthine dehydrogenase Mo-binding subunit
MMTGTLQGEVKGAGVGPGRVYSYSAQVAEVTVDPETGRVHTAIPGSFNCSRATHSC